MPLIWGSAALQSSEISNKSGEIFQESSEKMQRDLEVQRSWVSVSTMGSVGSVSARLCHFQRSWFGFSEFGSVSASLGQFQQNWVSFSRVGSVSTGLVQFQ